MMLLRDWIAMPARPNERNYGPRSDWEHYALFQRIKDAIYAVPSHFESATTIDGLAATDLHTLGAVLGVAIENQVVATLNAMRPFWDPDDEYQTYAFHRQAQVFPDVLVKSESNGQDIILGIELKGWYLLGKEEQPNYRFTQAANACAEADLLVVIPWALDKAVSGSPVVFKPFVSPARFVANYRNYWWQSVRRARGNTAIERPSGISPYPAKSDRIADVPASDGGKNFGRIARTGLMDDYLEEMKDAPICGISAYHWVAFLKQFMQ